MEKIKKRSEADKNFLWDINEIFADDTAFEAALAQSATDAKELAAYSGKFTASRESLLEFSQVYEKAGHNIEKVYVYAHLKTNEDLTNAKYQDFAARSRAANAKLSEATAFLRPEILSVDETVLRGYVKGTRFSHWVEDILTEKPHILSKELEEVLASVSEVLSGASNIFEFFDSADLKFEPIKDENGETVEVTHGRYGLFLNSPDREVRRAAFASIHNEYVKFKNSVAEIYHTAVKADIFVSKTRKYENSMHMYLSGNSIPTDVYKSLIAAVHEYLPALKKYIGLRKKALGVDTVRAYDLLTPIVSGVDEPFTYEEGKNLIMKALSPLGEKYVNDLTAALNSKWVDVYENEGKRSGAYQWGAYGSHPVVSLNYAGRLDDVFTLAHEMGHAMHSFYAYAAQPFLYASAPIFLAEIASTVNENILSDYLIKTAKDDKHKAFHLNSFLDSYRGTVMRQTMFAEFEMLAHKKAEAGVPLTSDVLSEIYKNLLIEYYGEDFELAENNEYEWSRIPHFYSPFYVYQYATGFSAAMAFSDAVISGETGAQTRYLGFLADGAADFPIETLKKAGLDMTSPETVRKGLETFARRVDELEKLL
ncbi:oligoendopeptidase F [Clostridia bacterium]|nr:oligoendopeptidase F [Clostridia bacterium]